jgi:hypothetical protein
MRDALLLLVVRGTLLLAAVVDVAAVVDWARRRWR